MVTDEAGNAAQAPRTSYHQILRSSVLIGGSSLITLAITLVRTKLIAMVLGPAGFGLLGVFSAVADLVRSVAGLGVNSSGVRQIAEAVGSGDAGRIARTAIVLRRTAIILAFAGAIAVAALATPIARLTFGTEDHAASLRLLGLAVFLRLLADGQGALIQGCRRLGDLARINILSAACGTLMALPAVWWLGEQGIALSLVAVAAAAAGVSLYYGHRVATEPAVFSRGQAREELTGLLRTGLAFMASAMLTLGTAYVTRLIIVRSHGLAAAGLYQAAWTVGGVYVGFVLQAMGADFYPRLVAVAHRDDACNRLVNEQTRIGLLIALPGLVATIALSPFVVMAIYSREYLGAVELLRWVCAGMGLRILSWPLGFIVVAKGRQAIYFLSELAWTVVSLLLAWSCIDRFGLRGAGIAFFLSYLFHTGMLIPIARHLTRFRWSPDNRRLAASAGVALAGLALAVACLPPTATLLAGLVLTLIAGLHSIAQLARLVPPTEAPRALRLVCSLSERSMRVARLWPRQPAIEAKR